MNPNFVFRFAAETWESVSPLVFPPCCCLCGEPTLSNGLPAEDAWLAEGSIRREYPTFCLPCETSIRHSRPMMRTACEGCGWPTGRSVESLPMACPRCVRQKLPHRFSRITPLYRYQDAVTTAVVSAKYPRNSVITFELARRLAGACRERWPDLTDATTASPPPIVTSVPSPWLRQTRRGGSGSRLLGEFFAKSLGLEYQNLLTTTRSIAKQAWLDDEARRENVRGAFAIRRPWLGRWSGSWPSRWRPQRRISPVDQRSIILIDDVMTTGATADEISHLLLDAGATSVSLAVVAIAIRES